MLTERRGCHRVNVITNCGEIVLVDVPLLNTTGMLINLSESGMALQFAGPAPKAHAFAVDFSLGETRVSGQCEVAWSTPTMFGVRFLDLSEEECRQIRGWLDATYRSAGDAIGEVIAEDSTSSASSTETASLLAAALSMASTPDPSAAVAADLESLGPLGLTIPSREQNNPGYRSSPGRQVKPGPPEWAIRMVVRQANERSQRLQAWRRAYDQLNDDALQATPVEISNHPVESLPVQLPPTAIQQRRSAPGLRVSGRIWWLALACVVAAGLGALAGSPLRQEIVDRLAPAAVVPSSQPASATTDHPDGGWTTAVEVLEGDPLLRSTAPSSPSPAITRGNPLRRELPSYPAGQFRFGIAGEVHAMVTISPTGVVEEVRILAGDAALAAQVRTSLSRWRYTPYMVNSAPVGVKLPVTVRFRIAPAPSAPTPNRAQPSR